MQARFLGRGGLVFQGRRSEADSARAVKVRASSVRVEEVKLERTNKKQPGRDEGPPGPGFKAAVVLRAKLGPAGRDKEGAAGGEWMLTVDTSRAARPETPLAAPQWGCGPECVHAY